jgi:ABC-type nitrate/sulfonate/bicarbonate transport system substrate-binding protein
MHRRTFIRQLGGTGLALAAPSFLNSSRARADAPLDLGQITYQLGWVKNFQFAGEYIADYRGYFKKFGLQVDLVAGGPSMSPVSIVMSGKALIGDSTPDNLTNANAHGGTLRCIGADYQRNPGGIISLAKTPLRTPQDMIGKKIGLQSNNSVIWRTFLKLNNLNPASIQTVPVQFDFTPLVSGEVDGFYGESDDDAVQLRAKGNDIYMLQFADYGYRMFEAIYMVRADSLTDPQKRAQLVAFMKGDILGWEDAIKDPGLAAKLTVEVYGKNNGLNAQSQEASCRVTNDLMVSADTKQNGLFWMSPTAIEQTIHTLAAGGLKATPDMFTNEILEEAGEGKKA